MSEDEKISFYDRAVDDLRRLRRYRRADIYRSIMQNDNLIQDVDDTRRNRRFNRTS
jgi:hypothetical protein